MKRSLVFVIISLLLGAGLVSLLPEDAQAATATWDSDAADGLWSTAANWAGDVLPSDGDDLVFPAALQETMTNDLLTSVSSLTFQNTIGSYHIGGAALTVGAGGVAQASTGAAFVDVDVVLGATNIASVAGSGQLWFTGDVDLAGFTLNVTGSGLAAFSGTLSGAGNNLALGGFAQTSISATTGAGAALSVIVGTDVELGGDLGDLTFAINNGTLAGEGTAGSIVTATNAGNISPGAVNGAARGTLHTGSWNNVDGLSFQVAIDGTTPGTDYDQVEVTGTVDLTGMTLSTSIGYSATIGDEFTIIDNDGVDAVVGSFAGLNDGDLFSDSGLTYQYDKDGGDGNDVTITRVAATATWDGEGGDNSWTTDANWVGDVAPVAGDIVVFDGTGVGTSVNDLASGTELGGLWVQAGGHTLTGNAFELAGDATFSHTSGTVTIEADIDVTVDSTWTVASGGSTVVDAHIEADTGVDLTLDVDGTLTFAQPLDGNGADLDLEGDGTIVFGANDEWIGPTNQAGPDVHVDVDHSQGAWNLIDGTLLGSGDVSDLTTSGGTVAPGASPGALHLYNDTALTNGTLDFEVDGPDPAQYDQLVVESGSVTIGASLDVEVSVGYSPAAGDEWVLIDNTTANPIVGEVTDLPDGFSGPLGDGLVAVIDYQGGDGNDMVIAVQAAAPTTTVPTATTTSPGDGAPTSTSSELPFTGSTSGPATVLAVVLLGLGAAALAGSRRRRATA
jgi:hypothetical protein